MNAGAREMAFEAVAKSGRHVAGVREDPARSFPQSSFLESTFPILGAKWP